MQRPQTLALLSARTKPACASYNQVYTWTPVPDLSPKSIDEFWSRNFDIQQIPLFGSDGAYYWDKLFGKQFSISDQKLAIDSGSLLMRLLAGERDRYGLQIAETSRCTNTNTKCYRCTASIDLDAFFIAATRSPNESLLSMIGQLTKKTSQSSSPSPSASSASSSSSSSSSTLTMVHYHPQCFRCSKCDDLLAGHHYCADWSAKLYCLRHYFELFRPRCRSCDSVCFPTLHSCRQGSPVFET